MRRSLLGSIEIHKNPDDLGTDNFLDLLVTQIIFEKVTVEVRNFFR